MSSRPLRFSFSFLVNVCTRVCTYSILCNISADRPVRPYREAFHTYLASSIEVSRISVLRHAASSLQMSVWQLPGPRYEPRYVFRSVTGVQRPRSRSPWFTTKACVQCGKALKIVLCLHQVRHTQRHEPEFEQRSTLRGTRQEIAQHSNLHSYTGAGGLSGRHLSRRPGQ